VLLIVGVIYFNAQTILMFVFMAVYSVVFGVELSAGSFESAASMSGDLKVPVHAALLISQYFFMLVPTIWFTKKWHTTDVRKYLRIRFTSAKEIILAALITLSLLPSCYFLSEFLLDMLSIPDSLKDMSEHLFAAKSFGQFIFLVFAIAVTPAICEEIFFRGYFQRTLERTTGRKSFIWAGVLFGLFHMQPLSLITLSILGILFSFFFYRSRSLFPSSAAHFTNNFIALLLLYDYERFKFIINGSLSYLWVIISLIIAAALIYLYLKITSASSKDNPAVINIL
jgi:membrane protease YdiL (CAAX protease family)